MPSDVSQPFREYRRRLMAETGESCLLCALDLHIDFTFTDRGMVQGQPMQVDVRLTDEGGRLRTEIGELQPAPASHLRMLGPSLGHDGPPGMDGGDSR